jgi:hypothetical protein
MRQALVGAAVTIALTVGPAAGARAAPDGFGGVNAQGVFWGPHRLWNPSLAAMAAGGVKTVRFDATWATAEPTRPVRRHHRYAWRTFDDIAGALARHGLRWQPVLAYSAPWTASHRAGPHPPPTSARSYAAFAGAFAARYGVDGAFWRAHRGLPPLPVRSFEIWNEENTGSFWSPGPDARAYADLYAAARAAIHALDPWAQVVVGGLANVRDPSRYVAAMLAHRRDLRGHLDAVGVHAYGASAAAALAAVVRMRRALAALGSAEAPIVVSEFGWMTSGHRAVSDAWRARQVVALTRALARSDCNVSALQLHTWVRPQPQRATGEGYGIVRADGRQTATAVRYLAALRAIAAGRVGAPGSDLPCWGPAAAPPGGSPPPDVGAPTPSALASPGDAPSPPAAPPGAETDTRRG